MAQKQIGLEVQSYIPKVERNDPKPFTIFFRPMTKGKFDEYTDSLFETKKGKIVSKAGKSGEIFRRTLTISKEEGAYLKNVYLEDGTIGCIYDLEPAVQFLVNLPSDMGNEIELKLRGTSTLDEEEEKN